MPTKIPNIPNSVDPQMRNILKAMRDSIHELHGSVAAVGSVTNLVAIPVAGGNKIRFSKSDADTYTLYISGTPSVADAQSIPIGASGEYNHDVAKGGIQQWYWVRGLGNNRQESKLVGPVTGTTLALTVETVVPAPPPDYGEDYNNQALRANQNRGL